MSSRSSASDGDELEFYLEPDLYDSSFRERREDVDFFLKEALRAEGGVLELGAGSGRVTIPLARSGVRVTAVDLSPAMLARLESRLSEESPEVQERVTVLQADMTKLDLESRFALILGTFNVIAHLRTREDLHAFFDVAVKHLAPGGRLVFDSMVPSSEELDADPSEVFECDPLPDPISGQSLTPFERFSYDPETRLLTIRTTYQANGEAREGHPLVLRQWFPRELEAVLGARNFTSFELTADYSEERDLEGADMLVVRIVP